MTALNKHAELRQLAEKATQGEWWSDVVETEGEYGEGEDRALEDFIANCISFFDGHSSKPGVREGLCVSMAANCRSCRSNDFRFYMR
ncbi:hypothetical protein FHB94_22170 [Citrobacter freundii]|uniref:hypothetical protein n=1 Tax=Citrobacter freundii TaxID=546 RepID=UPI00182BC5C3|nr:hypothetical protein [Citrobacter freundii]MBW9593462.1 hypothetical protein [Citrobacter freundii]NLR55754.1 hypothetical protein [Citrobacter freundii]